MDTEVNPLVLTAAGFRMERVESQGIGGQEREKERGRGTREI